MPRASPREACVRVSAMQQSESTLCAPLFKELLGKSKKCASRKCAKVHSNIWIRMPQDPQAHVHENGSQQNPTSLHWTPTQTVVNPWNPLLDVRGFGSQQNPQNPLLQIPRNMPCIQQKPENIIRTYTKNGSQQKPTSLHWAQIKAVVNESLESILAPTENR